MAFFAGKSLFVECKLNHQRNIKHVKKNGTSTNRICHMIEGENYRLKLRANLAASLVRNEEAAAAPIQNINMNTPLHYN